MQIINVDKSKIFIKEDSIENIYKDISDIFEVCKIFIITDKNIADIYLKDFKKNLEKIGYKVFEYVVKAGEKYKNLETVKEIYSSMGKNFISRSDLVIALGGGVCTDIAGFVSSTYKRGTKLIYIPTSFLCQIDASIGGKNGINLGYGKNQIGTFYFPDLVLIYPYFLKTLPKREILVGLSEAIKCGAIKDGRLFEILESKKLEENIINVISKSIEVKKYFVEKDKFDFEKRMHLNFGHTFGHAIEKLNNFENISHGEAIALGMQYISEIFYKLGFTKKETLDKLKYVLKKYSLIKYIHYNPNKIYKAILNDKKIFGDYINLIGVSQIGESFIYKVSLNKFKKLILNSD